MVCISANIQENTASVLKNSVQADSNDKADGLSIHANTIVSSEAMDNTGSETENPDSCASKDPIEEGVTNANAESVNDCSYPSELIENRFLFELDD